jgi:type VI protein secretion system component Hcp
MPIYVKIDNLVGTVKGRYAGHIEVTSSYFGPAGPMVENSNIGQQNTVRELHMTRRRDSSSTEIFTRAVNGKSFNKVTILHVKDKNGPAFLTIELEDVMVASYSTSPSSDSADGSNESFSLSPRKMVLSANVSQAQIVK